METATAVDAATDAAMDAAVDAAAASLWDSVTLDTIPNASVKDLKALPGLLEALPAQPDGKAPRVQDLRACAAQLLFAKKESARWAELQPEWHVVSVPEYFQRELIWHVCSGKPPVYSSYYRKNLGDYTPDNASAHARKVKAALADAAYDTNGAMRMSDIVRWNDTQLAKDAATNKATVSVKDTVRPEDQKKFANNVRQHGTAMFDSAFVQGRAVARQQL